MVKLSRSSPKTGVGKARTDITLLMNQRTDNAVMDAILTS